MPFKLRPRWPATRGAGAAALTVAALLALAACSGDYPNSVFHGRTEFNRDTDALFQLIIKLGVVVFILVFTLLIVTMLKYRTRPGQREPEHVHGNTTLEILWTIIPALVLLWIAIPTVRTIFRTQAPAPANSLKVEVIGHQWWWEFRYPEQGIVTANELYLPKGRTVAFDLKTNDVIHSFWVPALGGKRDLIANHVNHLWFTPDSLTPSAFNGVCVEYCGASHANMRFRAYVVEPADFDSWAAHQKTGAAFTLPKPDTSKQPAAGNRQPQRTAAATAPQPVAPVAQAGYTFPVGDMPKNTLAFSPVPDGLTFDDALLAQGDAARGATLVAGAGACAGCHAISGTALASTIGPNLTHIGSRNTIAAGLFPNDARHLALWIKNARMMKPGILMYTLGKGQIDPQTRKPTATPLLTDEQIADIVAYLRALK